MEKLKRQRRPEGQSSNIIKQALPTTREKQQTAKDDYKKKTPKTHTFGAPFSLTTPYL